MPASYILDEQDEQFVREMVATGRYASVSDVMRDGLRLVEERERRRAAKLEALRRDIREGLDSGPSAPLDIEAVKAEGRRRLAAVQSVSERGD
ncbi:type II toxin-antitoxin system ParD family antitoxin [Methylobacterium pseudosasicola]|uniref:Antitoxin ParD1/3/4 n=1 Tax=Methylobacterium pseudosasicola TaxID=582667 RepID=A0A1I4IKF0_9HYPH|nr:type II toxin-antitoxin system ParD family antitoxin [Methylobacterium pseudosasicola]SFL54473.1 antitoxin ParD1/3/4 [Methylobacterium pseudosasicola]